MANKKNVNAFQEAMLSNTKMIGKEKESENVPTKTTAKSKTATKKSPPSGISPALNKKILEFSSKYDIPADTIINKSIDLFLSLEDYWFENRNN